MLMWNRNWFQHVDYTETGERQKRLLESGKYSDLTIVCGSKEWKVHQSVVCLQSKYLEAVADGDISENREKKITLDDDPRLVHQMIGYLYNLDFDYYKSGTYAHFQLLDLYVLGYKYDMPEFRSWLGIAFREEMYDVNWTSAKLQALVDAAWKKLPSNDECLLDIIIAECARYTGRMIFMMYEYDRKSKLETCGVSELEGRLPTERLDDSDEACQERLPKPSSPVVNWKPSLEDPDFTKRLRQAMIRDFGNWCNSHPKYPWLIWSSTGRIVDFELTLEDLQRYLEMDPPRKPKVVPSENPGRQDLFSMPYRKRGGMK